MYLCIQNENMHRYTYTGICIDSFLIVETDWSGGDLGAWE